MEAAGSAYEEEDSENVEDILNKLSIETAGTEEEAAEGLEDDLKMEVEVEGQGEGKEGGGMTQRAQGALEFLTQDIEPIRTTIVDAYNEFNDMSRLTMLRNVRHRWPAGARFALNFYSHWAQVLIL